jgi:hypothetical protein
LELVAEVVVALDVVVAVGIYHYLQEDYIDRDADMVTDPL